MISFPLLYVAIPFIFLLAVWLIYSFFAIWHAFKFGKYSKMVFFGTVIFLACSVMTIFVLWSNLQAVDWSYQIQIEN